jgi:parallel beta-helix repeat protein
VPISQSSHRSGITSRGVRGWRRRRALAALGVVALGAASGIAAVMHVSDAQSPALGTSAPWGQMTLDTTNFAIPAGAVFVSPSGRDTNAGSAAAPVASLSRALAATPTGGTIVLRGGIYRQSITITKRVTLQAYPYEQPFVLGSDLLSGFVQHGSYWQRAWTSPFCHTCYPRGVVTSANPAAGLPEQVFINGAPLRQVLGLSLVRTGTFFYDITHHELYLGTNPSYGAEVTTRGVALTVTAGAAGSLIRGIAFARFGAVYNGNGAMVMNTSAGTTFDHDAFGWSASRGVSSMASNDVFTNNLFMDNGSNGFHAYMSNGLVFQNNRVAYSNEEQFNITPSSTASEGGAKITHSWNCVFTGNVFDHNGANGLWFDVSSTNVAIANNTLIANAGHGIAYEVSGRATIAGNLVVGNGRIGIKLSGVSGAEVWNNTVVGNGWSQFAVYEDPRHDSNPADNAVGITYDTANVHMGNNAFVADPNSTGPSFQSFDISHPRHTSTPQMMTVDTHNVWSRQMASKPSVLLDWQSTLASSARFTTLATAQHATGREASSIAADNVPLTALFQDPVHGNYLPSASSPLRQAGSPVPASVAALLGLHGTPTRGAPHPPSAGGGGIPGTTTTTAPHSTTTTPHNTTTTTTLQGAQTLSINNVSVRAPSTGYNTEVTFTISLSGVAHAPVVVYYRTADGTAIMDRDYVARLGIATFDPGMLTRHIVVVVHGNAVPNARLFYAVLFSASGARIADGQGSATIL